MSGAVLGVGAGLLLSAVWAFGASDVALALTMVFVGLIVAVTFGAPSWRRFGVAMLFAAAIVAGVIVLVTV
ncbi:hypothetical protein [Nocardioides sp.]|uniref:hypothetical protein n=1 Tax=Nocardioides sp. TaxID=35761 RepID=UPI002D1D4B66|nr:hypothetical protein [Nocardioides sp.]HVX53595.1 hypothetical protein [Nocardioides sp.]